jgi:hypothetical protein
MNNHDLFDADDWDNADLAVVLAEAVSEDYTGARQEELEDALADMLETLSPAEAYGVTKALGQIGRGASKIAHDPAFAPVAAYALPVAGGAVGTIVGGPAGSAAGAKLGAAAAKSLPRRQQLSGRPAAPKPPAAGGSPAAAQGLVLTQHPDVLKALLALAMGEHGRKSISGVPAATLLGMLASVLGKAATDADELMYLDGDLDTEDIADESWIGDDESLYEALIDADNIELAEVVGWS